MKNCKDYEKYFWDLCDGSLSTKERELLFNHLENCKECFKCFELIKKIKTTLKDLKEEGCKEFNRECLEKVLKKLSDAKR